MTSLGTLTNGGSRAKSLNDSDVVVGICDIWSNRGQYGTIAFVWQNGTMLDLREQLGGSTLSGYLALQGKVSQGEIGEQEYSMQRDYFRNELSGMIRRLDETRKLMMIMAQLDARPNPPQAPAPQQPGRQ